MASGHAALTVECCPFHLATGANHSTYVRRVLLQPDFCALRVPLARRERVFILESNVEIPRPEEPRPPVDSAFASEARPGSEFAAGRRSALSSEVASIWLTAGVAAGAAATAVRLGAALANAAVLGWAITSALASMSADDATGVLVGTADRGTPSAVAFVGLCEAEISARAVVLVVAS